jgi:hypothetical protein
MKTKLIFGIIAIIGALALYLWKDSELLAGTFVTLVWGVYERVTKEEIKSDFKERTGITHEQYREIK